MALPTERESMKLYYMPGASSLFHKADLPQTSRQPARSCRAASRSEWGFAGRRFLNRRCVPLRRVELGAVSETRSIALSAVQLAITREKLVK